MSDETPAESSLGRPPDGYDARSGALQQPYPEEVELDLGEEVAVTEQEVEEQTSKHGTR